MKTRVLSLLVSISFIFMSGVVFAGDVEKGRSLFNDTSLGTNNKSCNSCHPGGENIDGNKEKYIIFGKTQNSLEDAVNFCIEMALEGKPLDKDSEEMKDMVAYLRSLGTKKKPKKSVMPGY